MPQRAPTYYHWSKDKPCTTNQTYGYYMRDEMAEKTKRLAALPPPKLGPFDYSRPFSNCGFFPEISNSGGLVAQHVTKRSASAVPEVGVSNRFDINKGYTMGFNPISARVVKSEYPVDVKLSRFQSAPATFRVPTPKEKDIYLWHTLSGCLVHAKNRIEENAPAVEAS